MVFDQLRDTVPKLWPIVCRTPCQVKILLVESTNHTKKLGVETTEHNHDRFFWSYFFGEAYIHTYIYTTYLFEKRILNSGWMNVKQE